MSQPQQLSFLSQYSKETSADPVLKKAFEFDTFLRNSGMDAVLKGYSTTASGGGTFDFRAVQSSLRTLGDTFASDPIIESFVGKMPELLFDICFDNYFVPYLSSEFRQSFNNMNISHTTDLKKRLKALVDAVNETAVFKNATATDLKPDIGAITTLTAVTFFSFGQSLYNLTAEFNAESFKNKVAQQVMTSFLPVFYYRHLSEKLTACGSDDKKCKRAYVLARLVYVYYLAMSLFLMVFASPERTKKYKAVTNDNDAMLKSRKQRLLHIMDGVLIKLGDPALREDDGASSGPADLKQFYDDVKQLSLSNVQQSNDLARLKADISTMQNNLSNYNQMEGLNAKQTSMYRVMFYVNLVFWILVLAYIIGLTVLRRFALAETVSICSILICAWLLWTNHFKSSLVLG